MLKNWQNPFWVFMMALGECPIDKIPTHWVFTQPASLSKLCRTVLLNHWSLPRLSHISAILIEQNKPIPLFFLIVNVLFFSSFTHRACWGFFFNLLANIECVFISKSLILKCSIFQRLKYSRKLFLKHNIANNNSAQVKQTYLIVEVCVKYAGQ